MWIDRGRSTTIEILGSFGTRQRSVQETKNTRIKNASSPLGLFPPSRLSTGRRLSLSRK